MKILTPLIKSFGQEGVFLKKDIQVSLSLRHGKNGNRSLGHFHFNMKGDCNVMRKVALLLGIVLLMIVFSFVMRKKKGTS